MILHPHSVDSTFDQGLNPARDTLWILNAGTFGVSGGKYAGLKLSLAL
jgi:hypothetical protein